MAAAGPGSLELDSPAPWVCWILAGLLAGQSWAWNLSLDTGHLRDSSLGPTIQPVTTSQKQDIWKVPFQDFRPLSPFISPFHSLFPWGVCVCVCVCACVCVCVGSGCANWTGSSHYLIELSLWGSISPIAKRCVIPAHLPISPRLNEVTRKSTQFWAAHGLSLAPAPPLFPTFSFFSDPQHL